MKISFKLPFLVFYLSLCVGCSLSRKTGGVGEEGKLLIFQGMSQMEVLSSLVPQPRELGTVKFPDGGRVDVFEYFNPAENQEHGKMYLYFIDNILQKIGDDGRLWRQTARDVHAQWSF